MINISVSYVILNINIFSTRRSETNICPLNKLFYLCRKILFDGKKYLIKYYALGHREPCILSVYNISVHRIVHLYVYIHNMVKTIANMANITLLWFIFGQKCAIISKITNFPNKTFYALSSFLCI